MSYRLKNLAVGNFLLIFEASHSSTMDETLAVVEAATGLEGDSDEKVYSLVGVKKGSYGIDWSTRTVSDTQDLKFTPVSATDAAMWLERHKIAEKFASSLTSAQQALSKAELNASNLAHYLMQPAAPELEHA